MDDVGHDSKVEDWIRSQLAAHGIGLRGQISLHQERPWSTVLLVATDAGPVYFKDVSPEDRFEVGLTAGLAERWPDQVPRLFGSDADRGWMLLDGRHPRLRESADGQELVASWRRLLPAYAALQIGLADDPAWVLEAGTPDRRPSLIASQLQALVDDPLVLSSAAAESLGADERRDWVRAVESIHHWCMELDGFGVPPSINHGDLHDGNILAAEGGYRFFDWGDASLAHPFFSLRTAWVSLENRLGWVERDPRFRPLEADYLGPWISLKSERAARSAFRIASHLWAAGSLLSWWQSLSRLSPPAFEPYRDVLPSLARELTQGVEELNAGA
jgi:hypothetical protein